jgi:hypothetical protein
MEATEMLAGTWKDEAKMQSFHTKGKLTKLCDDICSAFIAVSLHAFPIMSPWPKPSPSHMPSAASIAKGSH